MTWTAWVESWRVYTAALLHSEPPAPFDGEHILLAATRPTVSCTQWQSGVRCGALPESKVEIPVL